MLLRLHDRRRLSPVLRTGAILKIRKLRISPRFEGTEIVYRTSEARYQSDFYNEWFIAPSAMVTQQLAELADQCTPVSTCGGHLQFPGSRTIFLEGTVNALYADLRLNGSPKAVLNMQIVLIRDRPAHEEIVFRREYQEVTGRRRFLSRRAGERLESWTPAQPDHSRRGSPQC